MPADRSAFRHLPAVDALLAHPLVRPACQDAGHALLVQLARQELDSARGRIAAGWAEAEVAQWVVDGGPAKGLLERLRRERGAGVRRALNGTGVVLNTGLGRAPWHPEAAAAAARVAAGFAVVEVDRHTGERNQRDDRLSELVVRLLGCEAALAVNNCAAAVVLALQTLSGGRETLLSRGELVEIGGSFRMPAVMERSGVKLVEVGTTNRTRSGDYRAAIGPDTALLLKVHQSNFRIRGFTEEASASEIAALAHERGLMAVYDLGSGRLDAQGTRSLDLLGDEPDVHTALASGVDLVLFSGDKLLGGPQAGIVAGRRDAVTRLRQNPLYRALRLDKTILAGLERTFELLLEGRGDELPARALLHIDSATLRTRATHLAAALSEIPGLQAKVVEERSQPGSGSAPDVFLPTFAVALGARGRSAARLVADLRDLDTPVFARVSADRVLIDPRTLLPGEDDELLNLVRARPWTTGPSGA